MNTATPITTAARRITRDINATRAEVAVSYDSDGHQVDAHPADMHYVRASDGPDYAVHLAGSLGSRRGRVTERQIQHLLDAHAAGTAAAANGGNYDDAYSDHLSPLLLDARTDSVWDL